MTRLRGYRSNVERIGFYRGQKLGYAFPRLYDIAEGEVLATAFLQVTKNFQFNLPRGDAPFKNKGLREDEKKTGL